MSGKSARWQQQSRWKTDPHQDRSFPRIRSPSYRRKTRSLGRDRSRAAFQGAAICFRPTVGAGAEKPVRRKLRKGEHVSGTDPDARHSRLPDLQSIPTVFGKGSPSNFIYRRTIPRRTSATILSRGSCLTDANRRRHRCCFRRIQATRSPWPTTHLAFRRPGRAGGETRDSILLTYFVDAGPWRFVRQSRASAGEFVPQRSAQPEAWN